MVKLTLEFHNLKELQTFVGLLLYIHVQANTQTGMYDNNETYEKIERRFFSSEKGILEKVMNDLIEQVK